MDNRWKNAIYSLILLAAMFVVWKWRTPEMPTEPIRIEGETMATTYHITYFDREQRNLKMEVDSLLTVVNQSINNYNPASEVSIFNRSAGFRFTLPYFFTPVKIAEQVYTDTEGAFDPTVMPLVNLWGFGQQKVVRPDSSKIDSLKRMIGFDKIKFNKDSVWKLDQRTQLDFGGIGQGYGADVVTDFLKSKGIENMLVELGGEGMAVGTNLQSGKPWELGILDPNSTNDNQYFKAYISLSDKSFTTSGNYFNYREIDGIKYSNNCWRKKPASTNNPINSTSLFWR